MPRGMSGSGRADEGDWGYPNGPPIPRLAVPSLSLPTRWRACGACGRNPPHRGHITVRAVRWTVKELDPRRTLSAQCEAEATELYPPHQKSRDQPAKRGLDDQPAKPATKIIDNHRDLANKNHPNS